MLVRCCGPYVGNIIRKIEIKGSSAVYLTNSWLIPIIFLSLILVDFLITKKPNYGVIAWMITWSLIVYSARKAAQRGVENSTFSLVFGSTDLVCKYKNTIQWHIPYSRISHYSVEPTNNSAWFRPKESLSLIYTKDGDSYSIPVQVEGSQNEEIRKEIANVIA